MNTKELECALEAVLFAAGEPVSLKRLAEVTATAEDDVLNSLRDMMDSKSGGTQIIQLEDCYQICTRAEYYEYVSRLAEPHRPQSLSNAAMEVLAVVAYRQPVTKSTVENIRGVNCDYIFNRLIERGLVEEVGRLDAPGRPILFAVTQEFMRAFGISSLSELPEFEVRGDEEESDGEFDELSTAKEKSEVGE